MVSYLAENYSGVESGKIVFPVENRDWALDRQDITEIASLAEGKHHKMWKDSHLAMGFRCPLEVPGAQVRGAVSLTGGLRCQEASAGPRCRRPSLMGQEDCRAELTVRIAQV